MVRAQKFLVVGALSALVALGAGCAAVRRADNSGPAVPPPGPTQYQLVGYDDAVELAAAFAQARGYEEARLQEVTEASVGVLRVQFQIFGRDKPGVLNVEVDRSLRQVVKAEEFDGVSAKVVE